MPWVPGAREGNHTAKQSGDTEGSLGIGGQRGGTPCLLVDLLQHDLSPGCSAVAPGADGSQGPGG